MEQLTNLVVAEDELGNIVRTLGRLALDTGATHTLLLDKSGQTIAAHGDQAQQGGQSAGKGGPGQRDMVALGALLAGAFSSSRQVAEMLGERDFQSIIQQGAQESILSALVGEQWLLVVIFDKQTHIGLVKVLARKAGDELARILERVRHGGGQTRQQVVNVQFRNEVESAIDQLFGD